MRYLAFTMILLSAQLSALALDPAGPVARIEGGGVVEYRIGLPDRYEANGAVIVNYRAAGENQWQADGWLPAVPAVIPDGQQVASNALTIVDGEVVEQVWTEAIPPPPDPVPTPFPDGIETPVLVLQDVDTQQAWGFVADNGDLIGGYLDHASPRPDAATLRQRIEAERQAKRDLRQATRAIRTNMTANIDAMQATTALTNGFTAAQNRTLVNDLRRELIDTQQELKALAEALLKMQRAQP